MRVFYDQKLKTKAGVGFDPRTNRVTVVYRSTQENRNWLLNINFKFVDYKACKGCEVHQGFFKAHESLIGFVRDNVKNLTSTFKTKHIDVIGYSLGGAEAVLGALELK
mmetsp:Transcript_10278/g.7680  ORF Transcript_10278/g.7680 Transcript_10278/m.7680 type:complete len:108 (+) Transcript_10278:354-677(+)|eukprot:CAMPEP_0202971312 /NCGR_PEP_ID=MMETSP1396-20130829/25844_1 /ASSEMBLY_ACC=CAM_ASM_000872 /TAXON_ID= /ORGANISM="Pseudokeronopsis sp., Strain Brazil" /LENGTH=107 /DNA_ID=CAMNT_0049700559 /DNA_START=359 /DNA_END=682 /DNA_ORIENTATION=-